MPNENIPYGGGANTFGQSVAPVQYGSYGDYYNNSVGYAGSMQPLPNIYGGSVAPSGGSYNFDTPSNPINASTPQQSSGGAANTVGNLLGTAAGFTPYGAALGAVQTIGGVIGMSQLNKEKYPEYTASEDLKAAKSRSGQRAMMGFTPAQTRAFQQNIGMSIMTDQQNSRDMAGGSLSQAVNARGSGQRLNSFNQFASADAQQQMGNIQYDDSMTDKLQNLRNKNTQEALNRRLRLEQAYGGAIKAGTENIGNSFDSGRAMSMIAGMG